MNEEMQREVLSRLDALAAKLGTTVEHLWPILVKQQVLDAITTATLIGVMYVAAAILLGKTYRAAAIQRKVRRLGIFEGDDWIPSCCIIGWLLLCFTFLATSMSASGVVSGLLNPEYAAFRDLMWMLRR